MTYIGLPIAIYRCCRDWPVFSPVIVPLGKCGYCNEVPEYTDKTLEQYMAERASGRSSFDA